MLSTHAPYRLLKRHICYSLASGLVTMTVPMLVHAEDIPTALEAEFDSAFLIGDAQKIDISRFKYGNPVLPGEYNIDVYVNGQWFGKRRMVFRATEQNKNATTCFSSTTLLEYGVKQDTLEKITTALEPNSCHKIEEWVENAYYEFDTSRLRIDISIPQIALQSNAQGYVDPSVWDRGIDAGFLSYSGSAYKTFNNSNQNSESTNAFMAFTAGVNLADWQFRHHGQWQWQDQRDQEEDSKSNYNATSTYLQKAFPKYRGVATIGDSFTNGELFDSIGYRGVDFSSDDRMLPNSMLGYAPRVRGVAKTNAKVEVRQQGQLIYQTTVAPGSFEINDLYPTGFGGELDVSVIEASGEVQKFAIPYASVVQMLRPDHSRFSVTAGQFRDKEINDTPVVIQTKYQRGLNNYLTGFTGAQVSEDYAALLMGVAFATPIGAISFDVTHSEADFEKQQSQSGQSYRISYSKLITPTNTNLTLAAYRYSTENYYKLRDALLVRDLESKGINTYAVGKQRSEFQITLNQGLPEGWGNFYMVGSWVDYWNKSESNTQYQVGYSNNYRGLTYGLSAINREVEYDSQVKSRDTEYLMTLSFPIGFKNNSVNVNTSSTQTGRTVGASGIVGDRLSYGASISHEDRHNPSFNINSRYRTNYATVGGSYSISDNYQQTMLSLSGNVIAHENGIHFGPEQGQTMVVVYAPDASGAKVNNATGLTINKSGYAVIPYVTPYRLNDITLDPQGMSMNVELEETSHRIAPFAGAISKVDFSTKSGKAIYIHAKTAQGGNLPFAAQVFNADSEAIGIVAQGSLVYLRTDDLQGELLVKWGEKSDEKCQITYGVTLPITDEQNNIIMTEALCK